MYHLERLWIWLTRLTCCRGFGIQSPSAYSFVRYVVNEHYPYYAYADLCQQLPNISKRERKLGEFFFRLANFAQAERWICCQSSPHWLAPYVQTACKRTQLTHLQPCNIPSLTPFEQPVVLYLQDVEHAEEIFEQLLPKFNAHTILLVNEVSKSAHARQLWHRLQQDKRVGVTFDLYYCGVAFFDSARPKQHYVINF